jgi:hypothetical protein
MFPSLVYQSLSVFHHFLLPSSLALTSLFFHQLLCPLSPLPLLFIFSISQSMDHIRPSLLFFTSLLSTLFDFHHLHYHGSSRERYSHSPHKQTPPVDLPPHTSSFTLDATNNSSSTTDTTSLSSLSDYNKMCACCR